MIAKKDIQAFEQAERVLLRCDDFIYILPLLELRGRISNYTITFPNKSIISDSYTIIPHGSATLVFSNDSAGLHGDLFGPTTKPCIVGALANQSDMLLIIEFQPAGLYAFTGINQKELVNQIIPFNEVNPKLNKMILEAMESTTTLTDLLAYLDRLLVKSFQADYPAALKIATNITLENTGNISCKKLSDSVYYSERHLNRIYEHYLGMSTKTFSRLVRINKAIRFMQNKRGNITNTSYEAGFYDLPHFIHDFKSVCGMTPQEYLKNMSDFYNEIAKF